MEKIENTTQLKGDFTESEYQNKIIRRKKYEGRYTYNLNPYNHRIGPPSRSILTNPSKYDLGSHSTKCQNSKTKTYFVS